MGCENRDAIFERLRRLRSLRESIRFLQSAFVEGTSTGCQTQSDNVVETGSPNLLTGAKRPFAWSVRPKISRYPQGASDASREQVGWGGSHRVLYAYESVTQTPFTG